MTPSDLESGELRILLENADYLRRAVIPPIPPCLLFADKLRLQQVLDNIFANSYKYADTKIKVTAREKDRCLAVSIEDYGGGISESELGLYIADCCMKGMQGRLDIANGPTGLTATVWIALGGVI